MEIHPTSNSKECQGGGWSCGAISHMWNCESWRCFFAARFVFRQAISYVTFESYPPKWNASSSQPSPHHHHCLHLKVVFFSGNVQAGLTFMVTCLASQNQPGKGSRALCVFGRWMIATISQSSKNNCVKPKWKFEMNSFKLFFLCNHKSYISMSCHPHKLLNHRHWQSRLFFALISEGIHTGLGWVGGSWRLLVSMFVFGGVYKTHFGSFHWIFQAKTHRFRFEFYCVSVRSKNSEWQQWMPEN